MFRAAFLTCFVLAASLLVFGAQNVSIDTSNGTDAAPINVTTLPSGEDPSATAVKEELAAEKTKLGRELCEPKGPKDLTVDTGKPGQNVSTIGKLIKTPVTGEEGPKKVVVEEKKVEEFPDNKTKEVTVKEEAVKLPSNETLQKAVVERKTINDTSKVPGKPGKEITVEKQTESKVCKDGATGAKGDRQQAKKQRIEQQIKELNQELEKMKEETEVEATEGDSCKTAIKLEKKTEEVVNGTPSVQKMVQVTSDKPEKGNVTVTEGTEEPPVEEIVDMETPQEETELQKVLEDKKQDMVVVQQKPTTIKNATKA